ncbi:hypothetical protein LXL04_033831 [Taraxacum kok-saghyz]
MSLELGFGKSVMTINEGVIDVDVEDQNDNGVETPDKMRSIVWQHFPYKKALKLQNATIPKDTEDGGSLAKHSFSQENCRLKLAKMCIKDNRPFSVVDDEGFQDYSWELRPEFILPSRWTVARDCMLVFAQEVEKIKQLMKG